MRKLILTGIIALAANYASAQSPPNLIASKVFSISNSDCVSVDADGEPWRECGFQSFAMSEDGSRILTVSAGGTVQLWNDQGQQIQKVEWADQAGGASGYPDAQTLILGSYGITVTHNNQIVVLDLADGSVLAKKNTDAMFINRLIPFGKDRVFAGFRSWDWHGRRAAELTLPDGDLRAVPDLDDLDRAGPDYWVSGSKPPFTLHRANQSPTEMPLDISCMPIDARFVHGETFRAVS